MKKLSAILTFFLFTSFSVSGSIIKENGFVYNTGNNYVEGNGLRWLRFTETQGMSVEDALNKFTSQGFRVANQDEINYLLGSWIDSFDPNIVDLLQEDPFYAVPSYFFEMFGCTYLCDYVHEDSDYIDLLGRHTIDYTNFIPISASSFMYAVEKDVFSFASIYSEWHYTAFETYNGIERTFGEQRGMSAGRSEYVIPSSFFDPISSVALVRELDSLPVPEPSSFWLLAVFIAVLSAKNLRRFTF